MRKEKAISESQLDELVGLVTNSDALFPLDREDVRAVVAGKEGVLYEATQGEGENNVTFMRNFFHSLKDVPAVQECTHILLCIGVSEDEPLMMDEMTYINEFFASLENEELETKWGMKNNGPGSRMSLLAICTKEI